MQGRTPILRFLSLLLAILIISASPSVSAQPFAREALSVCILPSQPGDDPKRILQRSEEFDCETPQTQFGAGSYWVISHTINRISPVENPLRITTSSIWQDHVEFYVLFADGTFSDLKTDRRGVTPLIQMGAIVEYPIPPNPSPAVRALWHIENAANARGIVVGAKLSDQDQKNRSNLTMASIYSAFAGLSIALIIYNLALWNTLRHTFQLYHCLMVGMLTLYTFTSSGALAWAVPSIENNLRLRLNYMLLAFTAASALIFARSFFEERVYKGWLGRATIGVAIFLCAIGLFVFLAAPISLPVLDLIYSLSFVSLIAVVIPTFVSAWRKRSDYIWLFLVAWSMPLLASCMRSLAGLRLLPWNFWIDNSTLIAMSFEAIVSTLAIAHRLRKLRDERDKAMASESTARKLADTDPLTGLFNRRALLDRALGRSGEHMLLIADLDHFKRINDTIGHDRGDEVLHAVARTLRTNVPSTALVARMGGEEFAIVARSNIPIDADQLLQSLRSAPMPYDLCITASIGVSFGPLMSDHDWKLLYRAADEALLRAKNSGRNQVLRNMQHESTM